MFNLACDRVRLKTKTQMVLVTVPALITREALVISGVGGEIARR